MSAVPAGFPYRLTRNVMIAAGILYCSLLLEAVAGYPLDIHTSFLSELGARDQATSLAARAMDLGASVLVLLAFVLARPAARMHRDVQGLMLSAAVFGVGTLFDSFFPMDCAPSASAACRAAEANGHEGTALVLHEVTSTMAGIGTIAMGVFAVLVLRRIGWGGFWGRVVAVLAAGVAVTNAWLGVETGLEVLSGNDLHPPGILQRVAILLVCLLLGALLPGLRKGFQR
ncbi:DUF998 domain-containing protein [Kribbella sandramycini]|uniref:DUF998 domain-containing protein n=1 Tax=Kribbella sandramycini TaxID=60450 RepID=A0A7Y4NYT5_9ACTN|nr:DUF998 domain-containing protein [Kribbella sandramycini]MBB6565025.1 hypothetical protein [Kribbella sandramycini]NOL41297.1 DUF998 domain-containing protein [Kribbella sandramycini]